MKKIKLFVALVIVSSTLLNGNVCQAKESNQNEETRQKIISILENSEGAQENLQLKQLLNSTPLKSEKSEKYSPKEYQINKNKKVIFISDQSFIVEKLTQEDKPITNTNNSLFSTSAINTNNSLGSTSAIYTTGNYTKTHNCYGSAGNIVWTAVVKGYFYYDNINTPKPFLNDAYYERGFLSLWQVSNWSKGIGVNGDAYCYARGNFSWGFEYNGNGLVIQDQYLDLRLTCNKNGNVY